jgi:hypothetical protein
MCRAGEQAAAAAAAAGGSCQGVATRAPSCCPRAWRGPPTWRTCTWRGWATGRWTGGTPAGAWALGRSLGTGLSCGPACNRMSLKARQAVQVCIPLVHMVCTTGCSIHKVQALALSRPCPCSCCGPSGCAQVQPEGGVQYVGPHLGLPLCPMHVCRYLRAASAAAAQGIGVWARAPVQSQSWSDWAAHNLRRLLPGKGRRRHDAGTSAAVADGHARHVGRLEAAAGRQQVEEEAQPDRAQFTSRAAAPVSVTDGSRDEASRPVAGSSKVQQRGVVARVWQRVARWTGRGSSSAPAGPFGRASPAEQATAKGASAAGQQVSQQQQQQQVVAPPQQADAGVHAEATGALPHLRDGPQWLRAAGRCWREWPASWRP